MMTNIKPWGGCKKYEGSHLNYVIMMEEIILIIQKDRRFYLPWGQMSYCPTNVIIVIIIGKRIYSSLCYDSYGCTTACYLWFYTVRGIEDKRK